MDSAKKFDVIVVGAGPAGVTAAVGIAKQGLSVVIIEGGVYPGAENWSGCVYFAESLVEPDIFGEEIIKKSPYERKVTKRGLFITDGVTTAGAEFYSKEAFKNSYIVLRPIFDRYLANVAKEFGVTVLTSIHAQTLLRRNNKVIGVNTEKGPIYSDIVFLAEGDASELVHKEGYENCKNPSFMQGIKLVLKMPKDEIEKRFDLIDKDGCAYEIMIRNGNVGGMTIPLNMSGFLYTNRDSISLGLIISIDNLKQHFKGDHNLLVEWYRSLPFIKHFTEGAVLTSYGAKIIRCGGLKQIPKLVDNGLAIGGAATGFGIDLPYPNYTGPASASGRVFSQAVNKIIKGKGDFSADALKNEYQIPLENTHYGMNAKYIENWPLYMEKSRSLFETYLDLPLGWLGIEYSKDLNWFTKFVAKSRLILSLFPVNKIPRIRKDAHELNKSLRTKKKVNLSFTNILSNTIKELFQSNEKNANFKLRIFIQNEEVSYKELSPFLKWRISTYQFNFAKSMEIIYENSVKTLEEKIVYVKKTILKSVSLIDIFSMIVFVPFYLIVSLLILGYDAFRFFVLKTNVSKMLDNFVENYKNKVKKATAIEKEFVSISDSTEKKLSTITYLPSIQSHIIFNWPKNIQENKEIANYPIWNICPAKVYTYHKCFVGYPKISLEFENCLKCESCWHSSDAVNWTRLEKHRIIFEVYSEVQKKLISENKYNKIHTKKTYVSNSAVNKVRDFIEFFKLILIHIYYSLQVSNFFDNTRKTWILKLFNWLELELRTTIEKSNKNNDIQLSDLLNEVKNKIEKLEILLNENKFLWVYESLISIIQDDFSENFKPENYICNDLIVNDKFDKIINISIIQNFEINHNLSQEALLFFNTLLLENNYLYNVYKLSQKDPTLAYVYLLLAKSNKISSQLNLENIEKTIVLSLDNNEINIKHDSEFVTISGKTSLFPTSLISKVLLIVNDCSILVPLTELSVEYVSTIGFKGANFARINFIDAKFDTNKIKKLTIEENNFIKENIKISADEVLKTIIGVGEYLINRSYDHAKTRVQFAGEMRDINGEEGVIKFGAVKKYLSEMEIFLSILKACDFWKAKNNSLNDDLYKIICIEAFGPQKNSFSYNAGQIFAGTGYSEDDLLAKFYRDSSFFRFLIGSETKLIDNLGDEIIKNKNIYFSVLTLNSNILKKLLFINYVTVYQNALNIILELKNISKTIIAKLYIEIFKFTVSITKTHEDLMRQIPVEKSFLILEEISNNILIKFESILNENQNNIILDNIGQNLIEYHYEKNYPKIELKQSYKDMVNHGLPYEAGQSLTNQINFIRPVFSPEVLFNDTDLLAHWEKLENLFKKRFLNITFQNGLDYEHYLEILHALPKEDIEFMKENRFFSTQVPAKLGGEEWLKAYYYILCWIASRYSDPAIAITVMANTSIGTTPVTIGLKEDLEKLQNEVNRVISDKEYFTEIEMKVKKLIHDLTHPDPNKIKSDFQKLWKIIEVKIQNTQAIKYLGKPFVISFFNAGQAGEHRDLTGFSNYLKDSLINLSNLKKQISEIEAEIPRRRKASELFYKMLSGGQISAFALTESTAGSDSGGVKTTGKLKKKKIFEDKNKRWLFNLDEENKKDIRYLIETERIEYKNFKLFYKYSDSEESSEICFDEYDYKTDDPSKLRYFNVKNEKNYFHDIAQIRSESAEHFYEYFDLSGTKMWITNGRIAGQFCLFANTDEGITGFIVDRHSEGLIVGKDELKMGQKGSSTNEISLQEVRCARENIIGIPGHGQVIALETLNSGRTGLAMASCAIMTRLLTLSEDKIKVDMSIEKTKLGNIFIKLLMTESLIFELISLWDSHSTNSVRVESAVAKYFCSELLHEVLFIAEDFFGIEGQTELLGLEKIRRDARILNIYEGTNEVQRFLILKDIVKIASEKHFQNNEIKNSKLINQSEKLEIAKRRLLELSQDALKTIGDNMWSNVSWQTVFFTLSEIAGCLIVSETILRRYNWIEENINESSVYKKLLLNSLNAAINQLDREIKSKDKEYIINFNYIKNGVNPPLNTIADFKQPKALKLNNEILSEIKHYEILCIVRPTKIFAPTTRIMDGKIIEPNLKFESSDIAGVCEALKLKNTFRDKVKITVITIGAEELDYLLKPLISGGVDKVVRVDSIDFSDDTQVTAKIISKYITSFNKEFDMIISGGISSLNGQEFLNVLSAIENYVFIPNIVNIELTKDDGIVLYNKNINISPISFKNKCCIQIESKACEISYDIQNYLNLKENFVEVIPSEIAFINSIEYSQKQVNVEMKKSDKKSPLLSSVNIAFTIIGKENKSEQNTQPYSGEFKKLHKEFKNNNDLFITDITEFNNEKNINKAISYIASSDSLLDVICLVKNNQNNDENIKKWLNKLKDFGVKNVLLLNIENNIYSPKFKAKSIYDFFNINSLHYLHIFTVEKDLLLIQNIAGYFSHDIINKNVQYWQGVTGLISKDGKTFLELNINENKLSGKVFNHNNPIKIINFNNNLKSGIINKIDNSNNDYSVYLIEQNIKAKNLTAEEDKLEKYFNEIIKTLKPSLKDAEIVVDVGYGIKNKEGLDLAIRLKKTIEELSGSEVFLGATRKVTQDLKLLPISHQIGQTGTRVNPKIIFMLGISGAPQHLDYINKEAIIIAFNQDKEAAIINKSIDKSSGLIIYSVIGDLFKTVDEFIDKLSINR